MHEGRKMDNKKKILIVNDLPKAGGVEKLMYDFVWHWHDRYNITVMTEHYCDGVEKLYPKNVQYICTSIKKEYRHNIFEKIYTKIYRKLHNKWVSDKIKKEKFDIAIAMKEGWVAKKVAKLNIPIKYVWIHTDYHGNYYTKDIFGSSENELKCFKKFHKVVCVANTIRESIIDIIGDPGNLVVKYNPIDVENVIKKSNEPIKDFDILKTKDIIRFVTVGRLSRQKGFDLLLEACHMLECDGLKFQVIVIGSKEAWDDEAYRLHQAQKRLNVKSVIFIGGRKNPYKYMKTADWFLSSSIYEGYSLVSQEAAVLNIPLILTDCSGVRELLGNNEYGIVMENSVLGIYKGMKKVIEHPELRSYYEGRIQERKHIINFYQRIKDIEELIGENC